MTLSIPEPRFLLPRERIALPATITSLMVDIHTHILPATDDGAKDMTTAKEMCRMAFGDGIRHIVCTPHANDTYPYDREVLEQRVAELRSDIQIGLEQLETRLTKRLFGFRGGHAAYEAERHEASLLEVEASAGELHAPASASRGRPAV